MKRRKLVFVTKPGCGLCDEALPRVARGARWFGFSVESVDLSTDAELEALYHLRIPVVLDSEGRVVAEGQIGNSDSLLAAARALRNSRRSGKS